MTKYCWLIFCFYLFVWLIRCFFCGGGRESQDGFKNPHFQNEAKCTTFLFKISFICLRMQHHFHIKSWALNLVFIQRKGKLGNGLFLCECNSFMHVNPKGPLLESFVWKAVVFTFKIEVSKLILQITQNKVPIARISESSPQCQVVVYPLQCPSQYPSCSWRVMKKISNKFHQGAPTITYFWWYLQA